VDLLLFRGSNERVLAVLTATPPQRCVMPPVTIEEQGATAAETAGALEIQPRESAGRRVRKAALR
jgi:hypothetical protein